MLDNKKNKIDSSLLVRIAEQYGEYRKTAGIGRKNYPLKLQKLALSAFELGCPVIEVSKAAGISAHSIYVWRARARKSAPIEPAKQLQLTSEIPERHLGDSCATIRLKSGIAIEVPFSALTSELFVLLSQVGP
jgi:transposase-like protein